MTESEIIRWKQLEPYTPPRHTGTVNHRLLEGSVSQGAVSIVHGVIQYGGEAESHYHRLSSQFLHILSGKCLVTMGDDTVELSSGDSVHIPMRIRHKVVVSAPEPLSLINVYHPALNADDILE